jgi:ABC-type polysaccharide/polyol phosphate transport system ATPase subunit
LILEVSHVSKRFHLREQRGDRLSTMLTSLFRKGAAQKPRDLWALKDVSLALEAGQSVGIVGRNGSGKSTLLKIINGTMRPTDGHVRLRGRKSALIELGAGFHVEFSGRDNVLLAGMIMGMTRREVKARFDEIIEFAELDQFVDVPIKYYSSGMQARLGFAVAIAVRPELLIVDEVLSVGDSGFVAKCKDKIAEMQRDGVSILLVSHNLSDVTSVCQDALWLEHGAVMSYGKSETAVQAYADFLNAGGHFL